MRCFAASGGRSGTGGQVVKGGELLSVRNAENASQIDQGLEGNLSLGELSPHSRPDSDFVLGEFNENPVGVSFFALIREDLQTHGGDWFSQGFWALATHRFGNWRMGIRRRWLRLPFSLLYKILYKVVEWACGISLSYTVSVGRRVHIWHHGGMILGARRIGNDVHLRQNTTFGVARRGDPRWLKPVIEDGCDIGAGVVIVGNVTIGPNSIVGANSVVCKDIPPNQIAIGVPAVVKAKNRV